MPDRRRSVGSGGGGDFMLAAAFLSRSAIAWDADVTLLPQNSLRLEIALSNVAVFKSVSAVGKVLTTSTRRLHKCCVLHYRQLHNMYLHSLFC